MSRLKFKAYLGKPNAALGRTHCMLGSQMGRFTRGTSLKADPPLKAQVEVLSRQLDLTLASPSYQKGEEFHQKISSIEGHDILRKFTL